MGACCKVENTSSQEQTIVSREHKLEFYKYSIRKIKEVYSYSFHSSNIIIFNRNFLILTPKMKFLLKKC